MSNPHLTNTPNSIPQVAPVIDESAPCAQALKSLFASDEIEGNNPDVPQPNEVVVIGSENIDVAGDSSEQTELAVDPTKTALDRLTGDTNVSKGDLVSILEGFVNLIKADMMPLTTNNDIDFSVARAESLKVSSVTVDDKTAAIEELRNLLLEAQETIIRLLNDRVDDRANMARLEAELRLLPDLQNQADRAIAVAINTDDFRSDLTKVKFELERLRLAKVREEVGNKRTFWTGVRGWFFNKGN